MKMIVGLGNPGKDYEHTRHNVGFDVITKLAKDLDIGAGAWKAEHRAHTARAMIGTEKVVLAKPLTYMNLSGTAVRELVDFYKIDPESELIVISDDVDLERWELADWVLSRFTMDDRALVDDAIVRAADAVAAICTDGIDKAMNVYNVKA